jgi:signal transduction histidine kinase
MKDFSLRFKITALAVLLGGLGMALFGILMSGQLEAAQSRNIDRLLRDQTDDFFEAMARHAGPVNWKQDESIREVFDMVRSLYTIEIEQPPGQKVYRSRNIGQAALPVSEDGEARSLPLGEGYARVYQEMRGDLRFRIAADIGPVLATQRHTLFALGIALPTIVALIGVGALWLTRKALQPVEEIARTADSITANRLSDRLPAPRSADEIGKLTLTLNRMMDRLQSSFEQSRRFASDASHELKTPLTIIRGEVESALHSENLPPNAERAMVNIQEETGRLVHIVEGLLLLSQADAGKFKLELERLDLSEFVEEMREDVEILSNPRDITFTLDVVDHVIVAGNSHFLRQVLLNLFDNAIKYNIESGQIRASLEVVSGEACFRIGNSGRGITGVDREHVFDRFYRADRSRDRATGGQGLGLSICVEIIRAHHGQIALLDDSMPDWTTFEFRIPLAAPTP